MWIYTPERGAKYVGTEDISVAIFNMARRK